MVNGWLSADENKKGLEILRKIGITDAVKVGISTAGNIKYTNPEGRIQIVQRSFYKAEVDEVYEMMIPVYSRAQIASTNTKSANANPNLPVSTKKMKAKLVKQYVLDYEQGHWKEIRKIWREIWGDEDIVLSEENQGEKLKFHNVLTGATFKMPTYSEGGMSKEYRPDGDYSDYFRRHLDAPCKSIVTSCLLQTAHAKEAKRVTEKFAAAYLKIVKDIFTEEFPKTKAAIIYTNPIENFELKKGSNGCLLYERYFARLQNKATNTIQISIRIPNAGTALTTIDGPDFKRYIKFSNENGKEISLKQDLDDCTFQALQNRKAINRKATYLEVSEDDKKQIRKDLRKACRDMKLLPNEKFKAKVDAIFQHYCELNQNTPFVPVLNIGKNKAPNYEKAYSLSNKKVKVGTVYGTISTRGMVEKKPFTEMLDKLSDTDSSLAKKKQATDDAMTEYKKTLLMDKYELSVTCQKHKYPYLDGSPLTMQTFAFGREISKETGEIQGKTAKTYTRCLREELEKTRKEIVQEIKQICREKMEANRKWLDNPIVPAVIRYIEKNEDYVTENAVIQALRGTTVQLQTTLHKTPECGKLNPFPVDEVKRVIDKMIHFNIIHTHSIDGKYGTFYILEMNANAETLLLLDAKLQNEKEEKLTAHEMAIDAMTTNPYQFSAFLTETKRKHEEGEDILQDQITLLQNLGNYYFTGYYFEEITQILSMDFSNSVKTYLEMMVFAAQDNTSLSENHKKLIAKIQTTVKKIVKEKKKEEKEKAADKEESV